MEIVMAVVAGIFELIVFVLFVMILVWLHDIKTNTENIYKLLKEEFKNKSGKI